MTDVGSSNGLQNRRVRFVTFIHYKAPNKNKETNNIVTDFAAIKRTIAPDL